MDDKITLSELNAHIKQTLQESFPDQIWLIAEIGEMTVRGGHCYLELVEKESDENSIKARARATIWSWQFRFIKPFFESMTGQPLQAGIKVLISATVEFHEIYGYSLNIKDIDPAYTLGDMARKRQETIVRLTDEGIIDMNKELDFPDIPSRIAVISSPTAAGYEDFMNQIENNERGFRFQVKLFPALMQGNDAPKSIISALDSIYEQEDLFDVVVLIRGGGAQLDLQCFDDYELAVNLAQFPLPIITGIGHEKDESIADMVANTRLKTPTAVAEFLIGCMEHIYCEIEDLKLRLHDGAEQILSKEIQRLSQAQRLMRPIIKASMEQHNTKLINLYKLLKPQIKQTLTDNAHCLENLSIRSERIVKEKMSDNEHRLHFFENHARILFDMALKKRTTEQKMLQEKSGQTVVRYLQKQNDKLLWLEKNKKLVDPQNILKRGYSITTIQGRSVRNAEDLKKGDQIETQLFNGKITSTVE